MLEKKLPLVLPIKAIVLFTPPKPFCMDSSLWIALQVSELHWWTSLKWISDKQLYTATERDPEKSCTPCGALDGHYSPSGATEGGGQVHGHPRLYDLFYCPSRLASLPLFSRRHLPSSLSWKLVVGLPSIRVRPLQNWRRCGGIWGNSSWPPWSRDLWVEPRDTWRHERRWHLPVGADMWGGAPSRDNPTQAHRTFCDRISDTSAMHQNIWSWCKGRPRSCDHTDKICRLSDTKYRKSLLHRLIRL